MKNISWKKVLQIALIVVVTCAGIAGVVEKTRKYINTRIDRMLAQKLSSTLRAEIENWSNSAERRQSVRGWRLARSLSRSSERAR